MRLFVVAILTASICALAAEAQTVAPAIKIGSWNIENLGQRKYGQSPPALAEHLFLAGVLTKMVG